METKQNVYNNGTRFVLPRFQQTSYSLPHLFQTLNSPFSPRTAASNLASSNMNQLPTPAIPNGGSASASGSASATPILPYRRSNSISIINGPGNVTANGQTQANITGISTTSGSASISSSSSISTNNSSTMATGPANTTNSSSNYGLYPIVSSQPFFPTTPAQTPNFNFNYSFGSPRGSESSYGLPGKLDADKSNNNKFGSQKKRDIKNLNTPKSIALKFKDMPLQQYAKVVKDAELKSMELNPQLHTKSIIQTTEQMRERERQIFALIWLLQNCSNKEPHSYVPRGQIFEQYSIACDQFDLKPLSQASLGKLIRTVFPNLTTRRLGMRGQSKYHYCGLKLLKVIEVPTKFKHTDDDYNGEKNNQSSVQSSPRSGGSFENQNIKAQIDMTLLDSNVDTEKVEHFKKSCLSFGNEHFSNSDEKGLSDTTFPSIAEILKLGFITLERKDELDTFQRLYSIYCRDFMESFKEFNFEKMVDVFNLEKICKDDQMNLEKYLTLLNCDTTTSVWVSVLDVITFSSILKWLVNHLESKLLIENDCNELQSFYKFFDRLKDFFSLTITEKNYIFAHKFKIFKDFFRMVDVLLMKFEYLSKLHEDFKTKHINMRKAWKNNIQHDGFILEIEHWSDLDEKTSQSTVQTLLRELNKLVDEDISLTTLFTSMSGEIHSLLFPHIINKNSDIAKKVEILISHFFEKVIGIISLKCPGETLDWVYYANVFIHLTNFCSRISQFVVEYSP